MEIAVFILYFVLMMSIGVYFFLKTRGGSEKEYFLGNRQMGPWVTAMSAQASDMSAWLLMGLPGSVMAFGFGKAWIGIGLALGTIANWVFIAARLRRFSKAAGDAITLPQYLSNRFAGTGKALQIVSALIFLVFFTIYVASSFVAGAAVFTAVFPKLDATVAMLIFAVIILTYTFLGGFKAVCWTDFFQGSLMLVALLAVPIVVFITGGLDTAALQEQVVGTETVQAFNNNLFASDWKDIVSGLAWGLGYFGMPHILVRFMSIKKPSMVKKSATVACIWVVLALLATCLIAYLGRMLGGVDLIVAGKQETVFIMLARKLFPTVIAGLLMAAIIAASMSTADSQLLVASSSFTADIYHPLIRKNATRREILWVGRAVVLAVAVVAFFIAKATDGKGAIMNLVDNAWAGFGSAFGPVVILSLFWRRLMYKGALAGIIGGAVVDVAWRLLCSGTGIYELLPGFAAGLLCAVVVTLIDKKPADEVTQIFDAAMTAGED